MSELFVSQPHFPFYDWPNLEWNQGSADPHGELLRPLTCSCFLLLLIGRLFLLALPFLLGICLPSLWSPPFPLHASTLILFSFAKVQLSPTWTLSPCMIWYSGLMALFLFLLAKGSSGIHANCSLCGTEATLSFSAGPVCSSFFTEACTILHALCWSRQHHKVCRFSSSSIWFSFCFRHPVLSSIFPFTSNSLADLVGTVFSLLLFYQAPMGPPDTRFSRRTTRLMSWPNRKRYLRSLQSLAVSLLLFLVSTLAFSRTGGILSHWNSSTYRFPRFPVRNLCSLVMLAVFSLVYAATDRAFC